MSFADRAGLAEELLADSSGFNRRLVWIRFYAVFVTEKLSGYVSTFKTYSGFQNDRFNEFSKSYNNWLKPVTNEPNFCQRWTWSCANKLWINSFSCSKLTYSKCEQMPPNKIILNFPWFLSWPRYAPFIFSLSRKRAAQKYHLWMFPCLFLANERVCRWVSLGLVGWKGLSLLRSVSQRK